MPTLDWIGKWAVVNHHNEVPFHLLKEVPDLSVGGPGSGNLLVEGDNLVALKALLPYYAGQIKCIYIDPPYNTGNEGWKRWKMLIRHAQRKRRGCDQCNSKVMPGNRPHHWFTQSHFTSET